MERAELATQGVRSSTRRGDDALGRFAISFEPPSDSLSKASRSFRSLGGVGLGLRTRGSAERAPFRRARLDRDARVLRPASRAGGDRPHPRGRVRRSAESRSARSVGKRARRGLARHHGRRSRGRVALALVRNRVLPGCGRRRGAHSCHRRGPSSRTHGRRSSSSATPPACASSSSSASPATTTRSSTPAAQAPRRCAGGPKVEPDSAAALSPRLRRWGFSGNRYGKSPRPGRRREPRAGNPDRTPSIRARWNLLGATDRIFRDEPRRRALSTRVGEPSGCVHLGDRESLGWPPRGGRFRGASRAGFQRENAEQYLHGISGHHWSRGIADVPCVRPGGPPPRRGERDSPVTAKVCSRRRLGANADLSGPPTLGCLRPGLLRCRGEVSVTDEGWAGHS
jgi:hypothetical protein